ncbi:MAG: DUF2855 family protein [Woeseiaceae bacterium]|nr:DUF2855 family protein [Woeseiaceae bacterium]
MTEFQVLKDNFATHRVLDLTASDETKPLGDGAIRVRIERFAFTANNITYAVVGEQIGYWQFFPPGGNDTDGWGIIPAWGFGEIIASNTADLPVGERLFGYFPTATHLDLAPTRIDERHFTDGSAHRAELPPAYNNYTRVNAEPGYDAATDDLRMLLWPLYITSFCLWDALQDQDWYGAQQVVIVSASSKTSIGLAYALGEDDTAPPATGITSARNREFVSGLGLYSDSHTYEALDGIDADIPTVIVDMSGNGAVLARLHTHLGANMRHCIRVGLTHWDENQPGDGFIAERSAFFFAPAHIQKRLHDWGPAGFSEKTSRFMQRTAARSSDWLELRKIAGLRGLASVYGAVCEGQVPANEGLIIELDDAAAGRREG